MAAGGSLSGSGSGRLESMSRRSPFLSHHHHPHHPTAGIEMSSVAELPSKPERSAGGDCGERRRLHGVPSGGGAGVERQPASGAAETRMWRRRPAGRAGRGRARRTSPRVPPTATVVVSFVFAAVKLSSGAAAARRRSATPSAPAASTGTRCSSFSQRILYPTVNDTMDTQYGDELQAVCLPDAEETAWAHLDHGSPGRCWLFNSDHWALISEAATRQMVEDNAVNQSALCLLACRL
uniref:Uncharacterized protein n=1 Tax=Oryza barthii TaxID=65489 RepID=A0A0D3EMR3_9ORYZ